MKNDDYMTPEELEDDIRRQTRFMDIPFDETDDGYLIFEDDILNNSENFQKLGKKKQEILAQLVNF